MSELSTIVQTAVETVEPDATFKIARQWDGQVNAHNITSIELPLFLYDEFLVRNGEIASNYNYIIKRRFILSMFQKVDTHLKDYQKEEIINNCCDTLHEVFGNIYKAVSIHQQVNVPFNISPIPEIFAGHYAGAALDMTIPFLEAIEACTS